MRAEKQLLLGEIQEKLQGSKGFIIAKYQALTAVKARELRRLISSANADFEVVRKRVFVKAAESAGIKLDVTDFKGHVGVIFADDPTAISKLAVKYSEENEKSIELLGGHVDGEVCSAEDILAIAKLPGINEMRAEMLGLFEAPLSQMLTLFDAVLTSVPFCLEEKQKKSEE